MTSIDQELLERWRRLLRPLGCPDDAAERAFAEIARHYRSPERHYHTLLHLAAVLDTIDHLCQANPPPPALLLAAWLHDVIYDSRASDNEERSAAYAQSLREPLGLDTALTDEAARLILLTRAHQTTADDHCGQLLLDADLAILGAAPEEYDRYAQAIRREYAWVPEEEYRRGRAAVLERFLQRPRLFHTASLHDRVEAQARCNLLAELAVLRG